MYRIGRGNYGDREVGYEEVKANNNNIIDIVKK